MGKLDQLYNISKELQGLSQGELEALEGLVYKQMRSEEILNIIRTNNQAKETLKAALRSKLEPLVERFKGGGSTGSGGPAAPGGA
jgi:hypothetical protein